MDRVVCQLYKPVPTPIPKNRRDKQAFNKQGGNKCKKKVKYIR